MSDNNDKQRIQKRPYGGKTDNPRLPVEVSVIGLGCSSFSTFFDDHAIDMDTVDASHVVVREWIQTIHFAIREAGITLLDTAPWYGHGLSERVVGWALKGIDNRADLVIQTKVGRFAADPAHQFDFGFDATIASCKDSLKRLNTSYVDVLQLHDPEFSPTLDILLQETIPALLECQKQGYCKAIGLTGYPLEVQHQIMVESLRVFGRNIWDQSLTYGHLNLHTQGLLSSPLAELCKTHEMALLAAAPLSMGLLTPDGPPAWHPATPALKEACRTAATTCKKTIVDLALLYALHAAGDQVVTTIVGLKNIEQVKTLQRLARRLVDHGRGTQSFESMLTEDELQSYSHVQTSLAKLSTTDQTWDGVAEAIKFWEAQDRTVDRWHASGRSTSSCGPSSGNSQADER